MKKLLLFLAVALICSININAEEKTELWSAEGTWLYECSAYDEYYEWDGVITAYSDGSYTVTQVWGTEGYDISFTIPDGTTYAAYRGISITNATDYYGNYAMVDGDADGSVMYIHDNGGAGGFYSCFSGYENAGQIFLYDSYAEQYTFTWKKDVEKEVVWSVKGETRNDGEYQYDNVLYAYDDGSYKLTNFAGVEGYDLEFITYTSTNASGTTTTRLDLLNPDYRYRYALTFNVGEEAVYYRSGLNLTWVEDAEDGNYLRMYQYVDDVPANNKTEHQKCHNQFYWTPGDVTGISTPVTASKPSVVNVYNLMGVKVKSEVNADNATMGLQPGIYIVGGKKVVVR